MKKILIWLTIATLLFTGFALAERSTENDQSTDHMPEEWRPLKSATTCTCSTMG